MIDTVKIHTLIHAVRRAKEARLEVKSACREINEAIKAEGGDAWRVKYCDDLGYTLYLNDEVRLRLNEDGSTVVEGEETVLSREALDLMTSFLSLFKFYRQCDEDDSDQK